MRLNSLFHKKKDKEPERNPYVLSDFCILKKDIEHQGIGGKKAYFEFRVTPEEIAHKAMYDRNIACINFIRRRPDLFNEFALDTYREGSAIRKSAYGKKFHYVKIWNNPDSTNGEYFYAGYVICSDEIKKAYKIEKSE